MAVKPTYNEKLQIIHNWSHGFEFITPKHVGGFTGRLMVTRNKSHYEMSCTTKEGVVDAAFRALREQVWWKVQYAFQDRRL